MKKAFIALLLSVLAVSQAYAVDITVNTTAHVYFSPNGGCTDAIIKEMRNTKSEILIQAYSFTAKGIAKEAVEAKKRGVHVEIVLDKSNKTQKYSAGDFTAHMGIPTYIDDKHAIAHNKIIIIDRETVITGSFNFSKAAEEKNAENLIILKSKELANAYIGNFQEHKKHSLEYAGR